MNRTTIQNEAFDKTKDKLYGTYNLGTGVGKSKLTLMYLDYIIKKRNANKILIIIPKVKLKENWLNECIKHNYEHLIIHLNFVTYLSLNKLNPYAWDVVIADEIHNLKYNHEEWLTNYFTLNNPFRGLTGTYPNRRDSEKGYMCNTYGPILYSYDTATASEEKIINDYKIYVHLLSLDEKNNIPVNNNGKVFYTSEVKQYNYWSDRIKQASSSEMRFLAIKRMTLMKGFNSKIEYAKKLKLKIKEKCLIFANTIEQAEKLSAFSFHSKNPNSDENLEMFNKDEIQFLSCVEQISEGANINNLKNSIILHLYGNNRRGHQKIGRCLRLAVNDIATIHVLCYKDTIDEKWVSDGLSEFNVEKIKYLNLNL